MQYREIGKSGIEASAVALGTWAIGGGTWWGESDDEESVKAIHAGIDAGITLIDTAPIYGWGRSEEVVGRAIKGRRDKVVLATKGGMWWNDERGTFFFELEGHKVYRCLQPAILRQEIEGSLKRLDTDHIDLYQTHWQETTEDKTPIEDTMACLMDMKTEGKIRAIGASNVTIQHMDEYRAAGQLDSNQPRYSMLDREIEPEIVPYCIKNNVSILAYTPLEQGLLTGKIGMDRTFSEREYRNNIPWFRPQNRQRVLNMLDDWSDLTDEYKCTMAQLVIAWTVSQPGITFALCGARNPRHATENAGAGAIQISAGDLARMRQDIEALGAAQ